MIISFSIMPPKRKVIGRSTSYEWKQKTALVSEIDKKWEARLLF